MKNVLYFPLIIILNVMLILSVNDPILSSSLQIMLAILTHETAHILTAYMLKIKISRVSFGPVGIRINFDSNELSTFKAVSVCLAGSVLGLVTAGAFHFFKCERFDGYIFASVSLNIVNLLPIKHLDGGEILSLLMNKIFLPHTAEYITKTLSAVSVLLFWSLTVTFQMKYEMNLVMLVFAIYLIYSQL